MMRILPDPLAPGGYRIGDETPSVATATAPKATPCYTCPADATVVARIMPRKAGWGSRPEDLACCPKHIQWAKDRGQVLAMRPLNEQAVVRKLED